MPAAVESMFYSLEGGVPWHGLGVGVEKAKTSAEAMKLAGLDWEVALGPVWGGSDKKGDAKEVPGRYCIYRTSDGQVYATNASDRYQPWQNHEAFDYCDSLLQDGLLTYETAGSLHNGARIFMLARLSEEMRVGDDEFHQYLLLTSGHDLYGSILGLPTNVRVVCQNTLTAALAGGGGRIKISHMPGMKDKLEQARESLTITTEANRRMAEWMDGLTQVKVTEKRFGEITDAIFDPLDESTGARRRAAIEAFRGIYAAERDRVGANGYAVLNAFTGYADNSLGYNGDTQQRAESRMLSVVEGASEKFKRNALGVLAGFEPKAALSL